MPRDPSARADAGLGDERSAGRDAAPAAALVPTAPRDGHTGGRAVASAEPLPGEVATRRVAQAGAALVSAALVGVGVYALRTAVGVFRR